MVAGGCSKHASRKLESPRKFSARTVNKDSRPLYFYVKENKQGHSEWLQAAGQLTHQENQSALVSFQ
jgi:hypothetical protein